MKLQAENHARRLKDGSVLRFYECVREYKVQLIRNPGAAFGMGSSATIVFTILKHTIGLRVTPEEEITGLDVSEHGLLTAYAGFAMLPDTAAVETDAPVRTRMLTEALQLSNDTVSHIPLHDQVIPWAMKKNVEMIHRADNRVDMRAVKVN